MTVDQAVVERALNEYCVSHDTETAMTRIELWLAGERREGAIDALRKAAARWPMGRLGKVWLTALADELAKNGSQR